MKYFLLSVAVIFSAAFTTVNAQSKDAEKYRKESEEMRKAVWAWEKPQFKVKDIPQQYTGASKIIIAHHTELTADSKSKFAFYGFGFGPKKEQSLTEVVREMVKVNDKNAFDTARLMAKNEGLLVGGSSGAAAPAATAGSRGPSACRGAAPSP